MTRPGARAVKALTASLLRENHLGGWIGFYWGAPPQQLRQGNAIGEAIVLPWLEYFEKHRP